MHPPFLRILQLFLFCLFGSVPFVIAGPTQPKKGIVPTHLTCEYQTDPQVVDDQYPRLSWINVSAPEARDKRQIAWQIRVATSPERLKAGKPDLWDSKRVNSDASTLIRYAGLPLQSGQQCWWQVRVWPENGRPSDWSEPAYWCMGLLNPSDWKAQWIGAPWQGEEPLDQLGTENPPPAPLLRKTFRIDKAVKTARAFVTGLGYFELYLNGKKVGDDVLTPNQTNYDKRPGLEKKGIPLDDNLKEYRVMYLAYDVTALLKKGENAVGGILGNGFYNAVRHWVMGYGSPRFLMQLQIEYQDGSHETVITDGSWKASKSAIVHDMIYTGEHYDARLEQPGWNEASFDDSNWKPVAIRRAPGGKLVAQNGPADRVMERIAPVRIEKLENGNYRVDFGQEISGWLRINRVEGEAGRKIGIRYLCESPVGDNSYTLKGEGPESYATRFTWYVFREVEISQWPGELKPEQITAEAVYSNVETTGSFECSNELFNTINRIWWRSQTDNMHGAVASDCPHRERSAYTGDGQVSSSMVMHNFDAASFYNKWIADIGGAQHIQTGYVPNGAPWQPGCGGGVGWGAAMNIMPWEFYLHYADRDLLEKYYPHMVEQLAFMQTWVDPTGIMEMKDECTWKNLGDWCPVSQFPPTAMVHTYFFWRCADLTAQAAKVLNKPEEAERYAALARKTNEAFQEKFWNAEEQSYGPYGGNLFALKMGVPQERIEAVRKSLKRIIESNDNHLDTGIFGTQILFELLAENGMNDLAYEIMNQRTAPSFGAWIEQGATTTWEQWDGGNSRNHPMFGAGLTWFYRKLVGVNIDPDTPGYRRFIVRPQPVESLSFARYSQRSIYGTVAAGWERKGDGLELQVEVPVGCTATVYLPVEPGQFLFESGKELSKKEDRYVTGKQKNGFRLNGIADGHAELAVTSGRYVFTAR